MALHPDFIRLPIAHRGLHSPGVPENSLAAFRAAIAAGYGIELDIQPSAEGTPMVFHDYDLTRMCGDEGYIVDRSAADLAELRLQGTDEPIPTLVEVLREVAGRVPLLIEIKDPDGRLGRNIGELQDRVAAALMGVNFPPRERSSVSTVTSGSRGSGPRPASRRWPTVPGGATRCRPIT